MDLFFLSSFGCSEPGIYSGVWMRMGMEPAFDSLIFFLFLSCIIPGFFCVCVFRKGKRGFSVYLFSFSLLGINPLWD